MKLVDAAKLYSVNPATIRLRIKEGEEQPDGSIKFNLKGSTMFGFREGKQKNAPWYVKVTDAAPSGAITAVQALTAKAEDLPRKREEARLKKLELEIKKLDEGLESTKDKMRAELLEEAKGYCEQALMVIHTAYMKYFKPTSKDKALIEKDLTKALGNIKDIS